MSDLVNRFNYHAPTPEKVEHHQTVRESLLELAQYFDDTLPVGREAALVQTKLEEVMFWANAAIARH